MRNEIAGGHSDSQASKDKVTREELLHIQQTLQLNQSILYVMTYTTTVQALPSFYCLSSSQPGYCGYNSQSWYLILTTSVSHSSMLRGAPEEFLIFNTPQLFKHSSKVCELHIVVFPSVLQKQLNWFLLALFLLL